MQYIDQDLLRTWLPLPEAAVAYEVSERTLRRRITANLLDYGHLGKEIRIRPPRQVSGPVSDPPAPDPANLAIMEQAGGIIQALAAARDELRAERDALRAQLDQVQDTRRTEATEQATEIGRLRGRLEAAEAELARLRDVAPAAPPEPPRRRPWERG